MRTGNLEWTDETSYSQATPKDKRVPTMWSLHRQRYVLTVFRKDPRTWYLCCRELAMWDVPLGYSGDEAGAACVSALKLFHKMVRRRAHDLAKMVRDIEMMVSESTGGTIDHDRLRHEQDAMPVPV